MRKSVVLIFLAMSFSAPVWAIENLGADCEFLLSMTPTSQISPKVRVDLNDYQILVRGNLIAINEVKEGIPPRIHWSLRDEFYKMRIFNSLVDSTYVMRQGDHLFVLSKEGEVLIEGYYKDYIETRTLFMGQTKQKVELLWPGLYRDPEFTQPLVRAGDLANHFGQGSRAVLVRSLGGEERKSLRDRFDPIFRKHFVHQMSSRRYIEINSDEILEVAHFERSLQGRFEFTISEVLGHEPRPHSDDLRNELELAVEPRIIVDGETISQKLKLNDQLILLNKSNSVVYRARIEHLFEKKAIIRFGPVSDENRATLQELMSEGVRAIVIRPQIIR